MVFHEVAMPRNSGHRSLIGALFLLLASVGPACAEDKAGHGAGEHGKKELPKGSKYITQIYHKKVEFDPTNAAQMEKLHEHLNNGEVDELELNTPPPDPMA